MKPEKPVKKEVSHPAIKIDGVNYVPVGKNQSAKPIIENGVTYIPVKKAPEGKVYKNPSLPTGNVSPITKNG